MEHKNFYENIAEANLRLQGTIVAYADEPFYIHAITNHKPDGAYRVYMTDLETTAKGVHIPAMGNFPQGTPELGVGMDTHVDGNAQLPNYPIIRKRMDSNLFNKFRPFPMGMMNYKVHAYYLERKPLRPNTKQGLIPQMISTWLVSAGNAPQSVNLGYYSTEFRDCVRGDYPSPKECLNGLQADNVNESAAFHRNFALVKGPIDTLFLAYKADIIGALPRGDFSQLRLGRKFQHVKEAAQDLKLFVSIT